MSECCPGTVAGGHASHRLEVSDLCVTYGPVTALCEVSFATTCGHRLALLGPNGAGKSTLIRSLAGLCHSVQGSILWRGKSLTGSTREIAYLPQLDRHREGFPVTVREVVAMGRLPHMGFWRTTRPIDVEKVDEALSIMRLENLATRQIDALSGGQRQRAFLARALAQEAHIVMLDEPFTGLDVESAEELSETLRDLARRGHLVIASHHNLATVETIFDQALVLKKHQIAFGPVAEVMVRPEVRTVLGLEKGGGHV
ncbi:metal ABC transporter ATP-binding protein [Roseibacillus ishigakijimensis]|uniref:ABC transporter ATP-binding protein n=1 Tax=Roseibacillus ishigakijimensis TaxID=454146 RepID=A0A934RSQ8_9BACT|nr:ABC transporter ATP-binding protein [Roseibacillus ishigakijimensis]MBK1835227.1 ABC transporter ATP-binding protein [Roseibacillus ishigakijimensis]